jgi:beta-glucanase (GH16 family)
VQARLRVPGGLGTWPAFWVLRADMAEVGWPACGEIDVMEHVGSEPATVHGTVHLPGHAGLALPGATAPGLGTAHDAGVDLSDAVHDYGVVWEPDRITWTLDGGDYATLGRADVPGGAWPFDREMHLLLNLAVGGSWPGNGTDDPVLPATLLVEQVRVASDHLVLLGDHGRPH